MTVAILGAVADVDPRFEQLFSRSLDGVFFTAFDQPIRWDDAADKEALLDYAFDHLRVTDVNQAMCEQYRAPREALIGTTPRTRWAGRPGEWRTNQRHLLEGGGCHVAVQAARADGSRFAVEGFYACLYDGEGRVTGHFGIQRDVSERLRMQERLAMSERLASLGTLAAGVGHEINNPLTYIINNLALVERELAAFDKIDDLAVARERMAALGRKVADASYGAGRVREIVRDLRSMSAIQEAQGLVDLRNVVERAVRLTDHELNQRAVVVRDMKPVPAVLAHEGRLLQVVVNMLLNAAQAIAPGEPEKNQIRIATATAPDGGAVLEVCDSGQGIAPEALERVFDPFFTTKEVGSGTGLGLAISHRIVTALGGDIEVDSERGRGSRFRVLLPAAQPAHSG